MVSTTMLVGYEGAVGPQGYYRRGNETRAFRTIAWIQADDADLEETRPHFNHRKHLIKYSAHSIDGFKFSLC